MWSRLPVRATNASERAALHRQWLQSGKCIRCFHTSSRWRKDEQGDHTAAPRNAAKPGPKPTTRASLAAEQVKMIQSGHPSPTFGEPDPNTLRPPGASKTVDPEAVGVKVSPGRMGENVAATQGAPFDQEAGSISGGIENVPAASDDTFGESFEDAVESLAREDVATIGSADRSSPVDSPTQSSTIGAVEETVARDVPSTHAGSTTIKPAHSPSRSSLPARDSIEPSLTFSTEGAKPTQGDAITLRIYAANRVNLSSSFRHPVHLARLLMNGQIVQFRSHEEKASVEEEAKKIAERRAQDPNRQRTGQTKTPTHRFATFSDKTRANLADKLVAGKHRGIEYLQDTSKQKEWEYNIMKMGFLNDTYLREDRLQFVNKVRSLLPASYVAMDEKRGKIPKQTAQKKA